VSIDEDALNAIALYSKRRRAIGAELLELSLARGAVDRSAAPRRTSAASSRRSRSARCSTTRAAKSITTSSRRCTSRWRNSDPDASVYWLARMVEAGEDPLYIARRLVRFASEDIGNADPQALTVRWRPKRRSTSWACPREHGAGAGGAVSRDRAEEQRGVRGVQPRCEDAHRDVAQRCRFTCATRRPG